MRGLVLVGDYFEDTELIATIDVLKRHNEDITLVSMMKRHEVLSKCGIKYYVDKLYQDINLDDYDFLFIPGGPGSFKILAFIEEVNQTIKYFYDHDKLISAICAAPMLIGRLGYLKDKNYTVYPGFETSIIGGNYQKGQGVVQDGKIITGKSMYYSIDLGLKIIEYFYGEEEKIELEKSLKQ